MTTLSISLCFGGFKSIIIFIINSKSLDIDSMGYSGLPHAPCTLNILETCSKLAKNLLFVISRSFLGADIITFAASIIEVGA